MKPVIREISTEEDLSNSVRVIQESFRPVATEFGLTRENCPTHPTFISLERLNELKARELNLFGLFLGELQIGFVAIEKADEAHYYMEKLAVLPDYRHWGHGAKLVEFVLEYARNNKVAEVSIGVIDEHTVLKEWYKIIGFQEVVTRKFNYLPFTVCYMKMDLRP